MARGLAETRPKRVHLGKLAVSMARQISRRNEWDATALELFCDEGATVAGHLTRLLPEFDPLRLHRVGLGITLDQLLDVRAPTVFVVAGDCNAPRETGLVSVANVLDGVDRRCREIALRVLSDAASAHESDAVQKPDHVVIEERPGKFVTLGPSVGSLKLSQRRLGTDLANFAARRDSEVNQVVAADSWGVSGVWIAPGGSDPRAVKMASARTRMTGRSVGIETIAHLSVVLLDWFRDVSGLTHADIETVYLASPQVSIAGRIIQALSEETNGHLNQQRMVLDDLLLGWHPTVSVFRLLTQGTLPVVGLAIDRFPDVEMFALWR